VARLLQQADGVDLAALIATAADCNDPVTSLVVLEVDFVLEFTHCT